MSKLSTLDRARAFCGLPARNPPNWPAPANFMKSVLVVWVTVLQQRKASDVLYI